MDSIVGSSVGSDKGDESEMDAGHCVSVAGFVGSDMMGFCDGFRLALRSVGLFVCKCVASKVGIWEGAKVSSDVGSTVGSHVGKKDDNNETGEVVV